MSDILAELLLPSFGTGLYLRSFHKIMLSLSLPSDLFMSKLDASRGHVVGSARMEVLVQSESGSSLCFPEGSLGSTDQVYPLNLAFVLTILLLTLLFPWRERDEHFHFPLPLPGRYKDSG